jgi:hypothetical protein
MTSHPIISGVLFLVIFILMPMCAAICISLWIRHSLHRLAKKKERRARDFRED